MEQSRTTQSAGNLLTPKEAADRLRVSVQQITHLVNYRRLACIQVSPRVRRFTESQLERFLRQNTIEIPDGKKEKRRLFEPKMVKREASGKTNWVQEVRKLCP